MPTCCVVPFCSSRFAGHRFPKDTTLREKWVLAIGRANFTPSPYSRICKKHFLKSEYIMPLESFSDHPKPRLKKDAVPSQFPWTKGNNTTMVERKHKRPKTRSHTKESLHSPTMRSSSKKKKTKSEMSNAKTVIRCEDRKRQMSISTQSSPLRIENLFTDSKINEFKLYTGFSCYDHFWLIFHTLGSDVNNLLYYPTGRPMKEHALTPANEFLLTVIKLRCNMTNGELALKFDITEELVNIVFITWISFLYGQFKERNIWIPLRVAEKTLELKNRECISTLIIDGTAVEIEQPKKSLRLISMNKSRNTLKVLIGISSIGGITLISDVYDSSICDRCLFEKCGLSDLLEKNDIILADTGVLDIPEFLDKRADPLESEHLRLSKKTSSCGIHIESVTELGKMYKILNLLPTNLVPLASRIIFVCFMLANFLDNIMDSGKIE